jgi:hypothetical protein
METNQECYVLYKGYKQMPYSQYEELEKEYKTAKCYYYHWRDKVIDLSRLIYFDLKWYAWAIINLPMIIHVGYDLINERIEYEYETKQLIELYHKLKLQKWNIKS